MDIAALRRRLQEAPFDFLSALSSLTTLYDFDKQWLSLREDVDKALDLSLLNDDDIALAHATATQVAAFSQGLSEADNEAAKRTAVFVDAIEDVFARLTLSDVDLRKSPPSPTYRRGSRFPSNGPSYFPTAYSWILQNIHNPYPSSDVKGRISKDAGRPLRVITDWFKDVRRRIGWVIMCKDNFRGSRALTVEAAKHVYLQNEFTSQLSLSSDIVFQFEAIRSRLRNLYPLPDDTGDISDDTDDSFTSSPSSYRGFPFGQIPYPRSQSSSSTPSLVFSTDDEDNHSMASFAPDDALVSHGKRKVYSDEDESRPLKRNRSEFIVAGLVEDVANVSPVVSGMISTGTVLGPSLPLPQSTPSRKRYLSVAAAEWGDVTPTPYQCDPRPLLRLPKRRLSVSDSQSAPKRPCLPPTVGPRKQAVSTPIPVAHQITPDIDDWFRTFELPDTSLSVELFSNWDVTGENDVFPYESLYDGSLQPDNSHPLNVTPLLDTYQLSTPLDLGVSSAIDTSALDISSASTESPAPLSTLSPEPITATASSAFDLLDAFLSTVNTKSAEPQSKQSSLSTYAELSLDDSIDIFGDLMDP